MQGAAARDVQQLHAAADPEDRKLAAVGGADQRHLERVDARLGRPELGVRLGAVGARLHVGTAGQAHAVDPVEQRRDRVRPQQRHDHRDAAGALDRLGILRGERDLEVRRLALLTAHTVPGRRSFEEVTAIRGRLLIWTYISAAGGFTP